MNDDITERLEGRNPDLEETYVHFGPGVPMPKPSPNHATAVWRGEVQPDGTVPVDPKRFRRTHDLGRRRGQRWILPLTVLIVVVAVVIYLLWGRSTSQVTVSGVDVQVSAATVTCNQSETLTAHIAAAGAGTIEYQWVRSDGTKSDVLSQAVTKDDKSVAVTLVWTFDGVGSMHATGTINILSPSKQSATASFVYSCAR